MAAAFDQLAFTLSLYRDTELLLARVLADTSVFRRHGRCICESNAPQSSLLAPMETVKATHVWKHGGMPDINADLYLDPQGAFSQSFRLSASETFSRGRR